MNDIIQISEMLSAVKWYFELKNLSLKNALALRYPLSIENQKDLRQYYSQYFAGLISATELLLEKEYPNRADFKKALDEKLSFDNFPDGEMNYNYLRELRNSIVHRGLDITSAGHSKDSFPLIVSPSPIKNRSGLLEYKAFGFYLIELIANCESIIGELFLNHFKKFDLFNIRLPKEQVVILGEEFIRNSPAMPDWAKEMALQEFGKVIEENYEKSHQDNINALVTTLEENILAQHIDIFT